MTLLVARQPVLDRHGVLAAWDLVACRGAELGAALGARLERWSAAAGFPLQGGAGSGPPRIVHVPPGLLLTGWPGALDPARVVPSLTPGVRGDGAELSAAERLRAAGFALALDEVDPQRLPWLQLATCLGADLATTSADERAELAAAARRRDLRLHARGVHTRAQAERLTGAGFDLLQGLFSTLPRGVADGPLDDATRARLADLARALAAGEPEGLLAPFAALVADRAPALLATGLERARLGQLVAREAGLERLAPTLFVTGLCSVLDAALDRPLPGLLAELDAAPTVRAALTGAASPVNPLLYLVLAWERADWGSVTALALGLELTAEHLAEPVVEALRWADERRAERAPAGAADARGAA